MIWPKLPSEAVEDFNEHDDEEFKAYGVSWRAGRWTTQ
jgi:hypothetical protein